MKIVSSPRRTVIRVACAALVVIICITAVVAWLGRDETLVRGSAYGFTIDMTKAKVLEAIHLRDNAPYIRVGGKESRPVPADLRPEGELVQSNYWHWALPGVPVDCHDFYFEDGHLRKVVTKKRLFETP